MLSTPPSARWAALALITLTLFVVVGDGQAAPKKLTAANRAGLIWAAQYNKWAVKTHTPIRVIRVACATRQYLVLCTTLMRETSGSEVCAGVTLSPQALMVEPPIRLPAKYCGIKVKAKAKSGLAA